MSSLSRLTTTNIASLQPSPFFPTASQVSLLRKRNPRVSRRAVSCNAVNGEGESSLGRLDRRNVLLGLGGLYGVSGLTAGDPFALIAPLSPLDYEDRIRMWNIWKSFGGQRKDFTDPDFVNAWFLFYDENAQLVRVKVSDSLVSDKMRFGYQQYLNSSPKPRKILKKINDKLKHKHGIAIAAEIPSTSSVVFPTKLNSTLRVDVPRSKKSRSKKDKEDEEEVLVVKGIELDRNKFVKFDVFINDEDDPGSRPENTEFAGSFVNVPQKHSGGKKKSTILRIGITELLEDLDADDDDSVIATLVPRAGTDDVSIGGIEIQFVS